MATANAVDNSVGVYSTGSTLTVTTGDCTLNSGNLLLANTTGTSVGVIKITNTVITLIHNQGTRNIWAGPNVAGNFSVTTGVDNAVISGSSSGGLGSFVSASTSNRNSFVGNQGAGRQFTTTSNDNSGVGFVMDTATSAVQNNTCQSATARPTGNNSIGFGYISGNTAWSGSSCIYVAPTVTNLSESNVMRFGFDGTGTGKVNKCYMAGVFNSTVSGSAVLVSSTHQLGLVVSSQRYKKHIEDMGDASLPLLKLRPVRFTYNHLDDKSEQFGLIAEEVNEHLPQIVEFNTEGEIHTVNYHLLPSLLLNELQKQAIRLENLLKRAQTLLGSR